MASFDTSGSKRGAICEFSRKSRNRLIKKIARLDVKSPLETNKLLTLTYPGVFPDAETAKQHLRALLKRLTRLFPTARMSGIWRMEFQQRGAPHFHVIAFGVPYLDKELLQKMWGAIIGCPNVFTRIEEIKSERGVMHYVSKYVAKVASEGSGFNYVPYLSAVYSHKVLRFFYAGVISLLVAYTAYMMFEINELSTIGRFWGVWNEVNLPYAPAFVIHLVTEDLTALMQFRRGAAKYYRKLRRSGKNGFFILCNSPPRWIEFWYYCVTS